MFNSLNAYGSLTIRSLLAAAIIALVGCSGTMQRGAVSRAEQLAQSGDCLSAAQSVARAREYGTLDPQLQRRVDQLRGCFEIGNAQARAAKIDTPVRLNTSPSINLSTNLLRHLLVRQQTNPPRQKTVLIVQDPHWNAGAQWNLHRGLQILFAENPALVERTVLLGEGLPIQRSIEGLTALVAGSPDPSESLIRLVLASYTLPGYVTFEWASELGIPVYGVEDTTLYTESARSWLANSFDLWRMVVVARNASMAAAAIGEIERGNLPILFIGGLHLSAIDSSLFDRSTTAASSNPQIRNTKNLGVVQLLAAKGIGYIYLEPIPSSDDRNQTETLALYKARMKDQGSTNSQAYSQQFLQSQIGKQALLKLGTTVQLSPEAALTLVRAVTLHKESAKDKAGDKSGAGEKSAEATKGSFWDSLFPWRGKTKTNNKSGKNRRFFEWDNLHKDVEVYDRNGNHLGSANPATGTMTKPPVTGRHIDL